MIWLKVNLRPSSGAIEVDLLNFGNTITSDNDDYICYLTVEEANGEEYNPVKATNSDDVVPKDELCARILYTSVPYHFSRLWIIVCVVNLFKR